MESKGVIVDMEDGNLLTKAYFVEPSAEGKYPAIIVIHEWWGLNDHIRAVASRFADEGYVTIAPDLYCGKVTRDPDEAGRLMQCLDQVEALRILDMAVAFLKGRTTVRSECIGVIGFCMGGTYALLLPCFNKGIAAAAPFYGDIPPVDILKELSAPVLFIGAENDFWITSEKLDRLKKMLLELNKEGEVLVYEGVGHAFFNDTRPEAFDEQSAADAWLRVTQFFADKLQEGIA
jgi:carboxymethylenebutenolidase